MRMTADGLRTPAGASFWIVAGLATLWNAFGCFDFTMSVTRNPAYMAEMPPGMIDWLDSAPTWTLVPWAAGVWGGMAGALLLLARSRHAVTAFAISLAGLAVSQLWQLTVPMPPAMDTPGMKAMTVVIWLIAIGLLWFAWDKRRTGVLR